MVIMGDLAVGVEIVRGDLQSNSVFRVSLQLVCDETGFLHQEVRSYDLLSQPPQTPHQHHLPATRNAEDEEGSASHLYANGCLSGLEVVFTCPPVFTPLPQPALSTAGVTHSAHAESFHAAVVGLWSGSLLAGHGPCR